MIIESGKNLQSLKEAEAWNVNKAKTPEVKVADLLDLEKVMVELKKFGISDSLKGVLENIESILSAPDIDQVLSKDKDLKPILVESLKQSLDALSVASQKANASGRFKKEFPDFVRITQTQIQSGENELAEVSAAIETVQNLIYTYVSLIESHLTPEEKKELGLEVKEATEAEDPALIDFLNSKVIPWRARIDDPLDPFDPRTIGTDTDGKTYISYLESKIQEFSDIYTLNGVVDGNMRRVRVEIKNNFIIPAQELLSLMREKKQNLENGEWLNEAEVHLPSLKDLREKVEAALPAPDDYDGLQKRKEEIEALLKIAIKGVDPLHKDIYTLVKAQWFKPAEDLIFDIGEQLSERPHAQDFNLLESKENIEKIEAFFNLNRLSITVGEKFDEKSKNTILVVEALRETERFVAYLVAQPKPTEQDKEKLQIMLSYLSRAAKKIQDLGADIIDLEIKGLELGHMKRPDDLTDDQFEALKRSRSITKDPESKDYVQAKDLLSLLHSEVLRQINNLKPFSTEKELRALGLVERKKDPYEMDIEEIIDEISGSIVPTDRSRDLHARYFELIGKVEDSQLESWYRVRRALQAIMVAGDTGVKGFDIGFDAIMVELADKGVDFLNIARALFLKRPNKTDGSPVTAEEMNGAEIDMRAIELYEYAVKRIKGKPEWGGLDSDPTNPGDALGKMDFSYNALIGDRVRDFEKHLTEKFVDIEPRLLSELIKYAQVTAAKSGGYVPWLMHATTRAHGLALAGLRKQEFSDELFVVAPFAAGQYSRNRYGDNIPNATSEELLFIKEHDLEGIVELENGKPKKEKLHSIKELWEVIEAYRKAVWGGIPQWVHDVRNLMGYSKNGVDLPETRLDLNSNWFPLPGEVVPNILKMEQRKRNILAMAPGPAQDSAKAQFLEEANLLGYGKKMEDIGIPQLTRLTVDQYMTVSFQAMQKFNKAFREEPKYESKHHVVDMFQQWMDKIIGKAKLVPGRHHLLFGPFTVRYMHRISHMYQYSDKPDDVDKLRKEMLKNLAGAGGLPEAAKNYVKKYIDKYHVKEMVDYEYPLLVGQYKKKLWNFAEEFKEGLGDWFAGILPFDWGKNIDKEEVQFVAPWNFEHVAEDTRK